MNLRDLVLASTLFLLCVAYQLNLCNGNPTQEFRYTKTDGDFISSMEDKYFTAQPFEALLNTTITKCLMTLTATSKTKAMNIIYKNRTDVTCQLFEGRISDEFPSGSLLKRENSTYYERSELFTKATSDAIVVGSKNDKPGKLTFQLPTGEYMIKLNHLEGGLINRKVGTLRNFGSKHPGLPSDIQLMYGHKEGIVARADQFTDCKGDLFYPKFVSTSKCFHLIGGSTYSFWFVEDLKNHGDHDNSGNTSFEMFVKLCEKGQ